MSWYWQKPGFFWDNDLGISSDFGSQVKQQFAFWTAVSDIGQELAYLHWLNVVVSGLKNQNAAISIRIST